MDRSRLQATAATGHLEATQRALQQAETSLTHTRTAVDRLERNCSPEATGRVEAAHCALQLATSHLTGARCAVGFALSAIQEDGEAAVEVKKQEDGGAAMQVERQPWPMASGASSADSIPLAVPGSGEWVNTESGALRAWYLCLQDWGGSYPPCGTVMPSKQFQRQFEEVGVTKQKWYCVCCTTRFRTAYGMLVEVRTKGVSTFMLAEVTNKDVEDVRAMYLEKKLSPKDHMDLWRMIPDFKPIDPKDILRPVRPQEIAKEAIGEGFDISTVSKFVDVQGLKELPKWDWDQIFTLLDGASCV